VGVEAVNELEKQEETEEKLNSPPGTGGVSRSDGVVDKIE